MAKIAPTVVCMNLKKHVGTLAAVIILALTVQVANVAAVTYPGPGVPRSTAPWAVQILSNSWADRKDPLARCTGVLISQFYVLTAAHCVDQGKVETITVGLGGDTVKYVEEIQVLDYVLHPNFIKSVPDSLYDIAVLRLATKASIAPATLTGQDDSSLRLGPLGLDFYGWGVDENKHRAKNLGHARLEENSASPGSYFYTNFNNDLQIAAGVPLVSQPFPSMPCQGDSGGPLVAYDAASKPVVIGITSYGTTDCPSTVPEIFTRVAAFVPWITDTISLLETRVSKQTLHYGAWFGFVGSIVGDPATNVRRATVDVSSENTTITAEVPTETYLKMRKYILRAEIDTNQDKIPEATILADGMFISKKTIIKRVCRAISIKTTTDTIVSFSIKINNKCIIDNIGATGDYNIILIVSKANGKQIGEIIIPVNTVTLYNVS
jgi:secreted trypsin-like serine protease